MKKLKTPDVIRQVAIDLFQKFGFEKTSMDEIAKKAHRAKRSIYNHYNSKEELFCAAVKSEIDEIRSQLQSVMADECQLVLPRLREYLLLRVKLLARAKTLRIAMKSRMLADEDFRFEELHSHYRDFSRWEHDVFKKVWYAKPTTDDQQEVEKQAVAFADMLQVTLNGLSHSFVVEDKYEQYSSSYELLINIIVNSVSQSMQASVNAND